MLQQHLGVEVFVFDALSARGKRLDIIGLRKNYPYSHHADVQLFWLKSCRFSMYTFLIVLFLIQSCAIYTYMTLYDSFGK